MSWTIHWEPIFLYCCLEVDSERSHISPINNSNISVYLYSHNEQKYSIPDCLTFNIIPGNAVRTNHVWSLPSPKYLTNWLYRPGSALSLWRLISFKAPLSVRSSTPFFSIRCLFACLDWTHSIAVSLLNLTIGLNYLLSRRQYPGAKDHTSSFASLLSVAQL